MNLLDHIRTVPNFPKDGINFYDIASLLAKPDVWKEIIGQLKDHARRLDPDFIVGIESRGFLTGLPLAMELGCGFAMVRKKGKLPGETYEYSYDLEYGSDCIEVQKDMISKQSRILIVDDLLATGGTLSATETLLEKIDCTVLGSVCLIELEGLGGHEKLKYPFHTLTKAPA